MSGQPPPLPPGAIPDRRPLNTAEGLKPGDVVQLSTKHQDKKTGEDYWWKRFAIVRRVGDRRLGVEVLHLKMHPDLEKDIKILMMGALPDDQVITLLDPAQYPQGVVAMRMKAIMKGWVRLGE